MASILFPKPEVVLSQANGRISKTRRHRWVLCGQTLKRTIAIAIAAMPLHTAFIRTRMLAELHH